jgi:hypothetical protein
MKTKVTAILAVFVITLSMMATLSFATELTPTPVVAVADELYSANLWKNTMSINVA